ncbi:MAG: AI-2E family transporter [Halapricum sp.]
MVRRVTILAGLLVSVGAVSMYVLGEVFGTIFFAITVAYVLYPVRQRLVQWRLGSRTAAAVSTVLAFVVVALLLAPLAVVLYLRLGDLRRLDLIRDLPAETVIEVGEMQFVIELSDVTTQAIDAAESLAVSIASAAPALAFKLFLFVLLVYALLVRPGDLSAALLRPVSQEYHDIVMSLHDRLRATLYAIYVLQVATAVGTFFIALVFFWLLDYEASFSLAVVSGILQFIPIVGPSVVVLAIAGFEASVGNTASAAFVAGFGLLLIGFLPDALIRPQLASLTSGMPGSLYFIGFVGGVLSIGVVGVIAGPVVVGLLAEIGELLADERAPAAATD